MVQVMQESKRLQFGEIELYTALQGKTIAGSNISALAEVLRLAMLKVGLRAANLPNKEETAVLIEYIFTNFGNFRHGEIKLAFDLALSGRLNLDRKEVSCYENFSCLYFSNIMIAYREWSREAVKNVSREIERIKLSY